VIPFVLVWLRAAGLAGQAVALGGALFALVVLSRGREPGTARAVDRTLRITMLGALVAAGAQLGVLVALGRELAEDAGWPIADLLSSTVGLMGLTRVAVACVAAAAALMLRRAPGSGGLGGLLLVATFLLSFTGALAGHAIGRLEGQLGLWSVSAVHQAAAGAWLGGLVCAAVLAVRSQGDPSERWLHRFSALAATAVAVLATTGMTLSLAYVGTLGALITTSYGAMVLTKIVLFIALLAMGVLNHRAVHGRIRLWPRPARVAVTGVSPLTLRRRLEVEAGLGLVALAMAASLSSAPPAIDVTTGRATLEEVRRIFTPQWPRWQAPSAAELAAASDLGDPRAPRTAENRQWSEFGHHVAGVFVVSMGLLAMLERTGQAPWARH